MKQAVSYLLTFALGTSLGLWIGKSSDKAPTSFPSHVKTSPAQELRTTTQSPSISEASSPSAPLQGTTKSQTSHLAEKSSGHSDIHTQREEFENFMNQDELDGAASALRRMEATSSYSQQFLESKSRLLVRQRDWEDAKVALKKCLEAYPSSKACLVDLSSTELQIGSKEEQEKAISSCLAQSPNDPQCRNMLAILKMNQGKYGDAVSVYRQLIKDNGSFGVRFDDGMLNWQLAISLEGAGNLPEAVTYFDKACRNNFRSACKKYEEVRAKL